MSKDKWTGRVLRDRNRGWEKRTVRVLGVSERQSSSVGASVKSTVYDVEQVTNLRGERETKRARIQEHILATKWRDA